VPIRAPLDTFCNWCYKNHLLAYLHNIIVYSECVNTLLTVSSDVTLEPVNIAAIVDQNVIFTCATHKPGQVRWDYYKDRLLQHYTIWNGLTVRQPVGDPPDTPLFHVNKYQFKNETRCDLTINKVALRDAGWIACSRAGSNTLFVSSLTVLGESQLIIAFC